MIIEILSRLAALYLSKKTIVEALKMSASSNSFQERIDNVESDYETALLKVRSFIKGDRCPRNFGKIVDFLENEIALNKAELATLTN